MVNKTEFVKFYKENYKIVIGYTYKRIVKWEDVEDIVSNSFLALWENRSNLTEDNIKNYLYGILKNKTYDYLRSKYKIDLNNISFEEYEDIIIDENDGKNSRSKSKNMNLILEMSKELKEREQRLIKLKYVEKKTNREISEELGISINNVKVLNNRIIKKLKKLWIQNL
jgi:RNA polymerase sigma-70 factor (ECF subfamily)